MKINKVDDNFSATAQVTVDDISAIKAAGFASIICNRPDGESSGQPSFEEVSAAAKAEGITAVHIPLSKDKVPSDEVPLFAEALQELPSPTLGYCRSGLRSVTLWSLAQLKQDNMRSDQIIAAATGAGYDISKILTPNK